MTNTGSSSDTIAAARATVESALTLDRTSTRLLQGTQARMAAAQADFDAGIAGANVSTVLAATNALQVAIGASLFAAHYQDSCRATVATSLDALSRPEVRPPGPAGERQAAPAADAIVVAEASAIAAAAEARLATETYAETVRAASRAHDAVLLAASTVARAAEDEQRARAVADALAAEEVAAAAASAAHHVQRRADDAAAAVSAAARVAASRMPMPLDSHAALAADRLAALVIADAASTARETADAAAIVADAVALAASTVSAATAAHAAAAEQDVRAAAQAVRSTAEVIAVELAAASSLARAASPPAAPRPAVAEQTTARSQ